MNTLYNMYIIAGMASRNNQKWIKQVLFLVLGTFYNPARETQEVFFGGAICRYIQYIRVTSLSTIMA